MPAWILNRHDHWTPLEIEPHGIALALDDTGRLAAAGLSGSPVAEIVPWDDPQGRTHYVFFPSSHRLHFQVNGTGLFSHRLLADTDEISLRHEDRRIHFYFSSETLPRIRALSSSDAPGAVFCMRCKLRIEPGDLAISCPKCGLWYHESIEKPCWSYDAACANCGRPTSMDYCWKPEPTAGPARSRTNPPRRLQFERRSHE